MFCLSMTFYFPFINPPPSNNPATSAHHILVKVLWIFCIVFRAATKSCDVFFPNATSQIPPFALCISNDSLVGFATIVAQPMCMVMAITAFCRTYFMYCKSSSQSCESLV